jgi:hypothetical protein
MKRHLPLTGLFAVLACLTLLACDPEDPTGDDDTTEAVDPIHVDIDEECDNVNPDYCMLPWPSSRYLVADDSTATGWRVDYREDAFTKNHMDQPFDVEPYNRLDGFSPASQLLTVFDAPVDASALPFHDSYGLSLDTDCPTVVLDMETGERLAHFAEFDTRFDYPGEIMMYIRPAERLEENRRYAVAIRGLQFEDGGEVPPSEVFAALRDGVVTDADQVEARRPGFEEVFTALEGAGVERDGLIQAWDFHTASGEMIWGDLLHMRDDAFERLGADGLGCAITSMEEFTPEENDQIFRKIEGTYTVPSYMDSPYPPARVVRGDDGRPEFQENQEIEFFVNIPQSVAELGGHPARLITHGHGLMDSGEAVFWSGERGIAQDVGVVMVGTHWAGMSEGDLVTVATALSNVSSFPNVAERTMQGILNMLALTRTMTGACADEPEFQIDGTPAFDTDESYYLGISQGAIYGHTYMALSQDVERGILNVGGAIYPVMIGRSVDFRDYELVYEAWYSDRIDREFFMNLIQQLWDMCEGAGFLPHLLDDPFPDTEAKKIIHQIALHDAQVPNVASDMGARIADMPQLVPTMHEIWGVEDAPTEPFDGSAIQYWDCGDEPLDPGNNPPEEDNTAHDCVRRLVAAKNQMDAFWQPDGQVVNFCDGECDPE